jgi:hypothetical protein
MKTFKEFLGFNPTTGKAEFLQLVECSAPWYRRILNIHDKAEQDENGDWPWV